MHNSTSVLGIETLKLLRDFEIKTDHLISDRRPDLIIINKKRENLLNCYFAIPADHRMKLKKKNAKKDKYVDLARKLKKKQTMEHRNDVNTNYNWCSWYSHRSVIKETGGLGNKRTSGYHPNYNIIEIGQNTEKSPEDLKRVAVTETSVKDHHILPWPFG